VLVAGFIGSLAGASSAAAATAAAPDAGGSLQACTAYAYAAIQAHTVAPATPPACAGLSRAQVNQAVSTAIRRTVTSGDKATRRRQAVAAARWTRAMITAPAPAPAPASPSPESSGLRPAPDAKAGGRGLGGVSQLAANIGALLAWLATAASGGWILARWLLAGGGLRRKSAGAAPPAVTLSHVGGGALGLLLWVVFMATGWVALAWIALGLLAPVAGLGMSVLLFGLPRPARAPLGPRGRGRAAGFPAAAAAVHGLFVVVVLTLVLTATVAAG
jgi:hypothetical protein